MLLVVLGTVAFPQANECKSQEIANMVWAFATASHTGGSLFAELTSVVELRVNELSQREVTNIAWALAKVQESTNESLMVALAKAVEREAGKFTAQNLANTT
eukprot:gnl/TRDRNA2_/TRDRNA2_176403_c3_seq1.p2 gnl/TRDRNA2_/TRDRNA2_176403_c3~~gnl/TRDRNA2_/TRDRNA2_176403_c3_seq1.p2  ORF type:complete len:102 (+),score=22.13 gnl/TRDRNA2_/TRDRNA2_176403_c3_seq1:483-788(+)